MIIHEVEQGTTEWHLLRHAKVTGTSIKDVMKADNLGLIDRLIAEEEVGYQGTDDYISDEMQRGIDEEPNARKAYEHRFKKKVTQVGFLQHDTLWSWFGLSSDGLVYEKKKLVGAIEIKCPNTTTHVKRIRQNQLPADYKYQALSHFIVSDEIKWVDFISYDARFVRKPLFCFRTTREDVAEDIIKMKESMDAFEKKLIKYKEEVLF